MDLTCQFFGQADLTSPERGRLSHGALLLQKDGIEGNCFPIEPDHIGISRSQSWREGIRDILRLLKKLKVDIGTCSSSLFIGSLI